MKILLTGATGFLGRNLIPKLVEADFELIVLARNANSSLDSLRHISTTDVNWKEEVRSVKPDIVIHLASHLTSSDDEAAINKLIDANIKFGIDLLDAIKPIKIKYFINTGTFAEYASKSILLEPAYLYAATKTAFRSIIHYYQRIIGFKSINVIPYTIYGGADSKKKLIDIIYDSLNNDKATQMSPGNQCLDFIHIDDVVDFYLSLVKNLDSIIDDNTEIHLGTGIGNTPKQIACFIEEATGEKANINWGGLPYRPLDTMFSVAKFNLPKKFFDWSPTINIEKGIQKFLISKYNKK